MSRMQIRSGGASIPLTTTASGEPAGVTVIETKTGAAPMPVESGPYQYQNCPVSVTTICGTTGAPGDFLHTVTIRWNGTGTFTLKDGSTAILTATGIGTPSAIQVKNLIIDAICITNWSITTTSGTEALATGRFT